MCLGDLGLLVSLKDSNLYLPGNLGTTLGLAFFCCGGVWLVGWVVFVVVVISQFCFQEWLEVSE